MTIQEKANGSVAGRACGLGGVQPCRGPSTPQPDAAKNGAEEKVGLLRSG